VDVRIGVTHNPKEITLELADDVDRDDLMSQIGKALDPNGPTTVLWLTDKRGRSVGVPADRVAYVDIGVVEDRRIGFGS